MEKVYIVDTNVALFKPNFFEDDMFEDGSVAVTLTTISEIDHIKENSQNQELKAKARDASRKLEKASDEGVVEIIKTNSNNADESFSCYEKMDDLIITTAYNYGVNNNKEIIMVSRDLNFRIKCRGLDLEAIDYNSKCDGLKKLYSGVIEAEVFDCDINAFYSQGYIELSDLKLEREPYPNEFLIARSQMDKKRKIVARFIKKNNRFEKLKHAEKSFYGFKPKDIYQKFALELLYDEDVKVVTMTAKQGSGKTFMTVGALLDMVVEQGNYEKLLIGKNTTPLDKWSYQGFTKGETDMKLLTHFNNYLTTLENLHNKKGKDTNGMDLLYGLQSLNKLDVLDISSILGSSFNNKAICIDEAQSFGITPMRSILTRPSDSCKLCIIGDIRQQTMTSLVEMTMGYMLL